MSLNARNLTRSFGKLEAVSEVSIEIHPGQIVGLIGPNGCGKTTTMLMLSGLLRPHHGWVSVDDTVIGSAEDDHVCTRQSASQARSRIGWMPDEFGSWDALECLQVLEIFGGLYDVASPRERAMQMLELMRLEKQAKQRLHTLSRGQKQRLGLARTLMHDPKYLILDEPANGMDPRARIELRGLLRSVADSGHGVLISSHILSELQDSIDDAVFMAAGRRVEIVPTPTNRWMLRVLNRETWDVFASKLDFTSDFRPAASAHVSSIEISGAASVQVLQSHTHGDDGGLEVVFTAKTVNEAAEFLRLACTAGVLVSQMMPLSDDLESRYMTLEGGD